VRWLLVAVVVLVAAVPGAEPDPELHAAQAELRLAKSELDAMQGAYGGHRRAAIDHVKRAMREIKLGLLDAAVAREHGEPRPHR
jgi:hypothetical protein